MRSTGGGEGCVVGGLMIVGWSNTKFGKSEIPDLNPRWQPAITFFPLALNTGFFNTVFKPIWNIVVCDSFRISL